MDGHRRWCGIGDSINLYERNFDVNEWALRSSNRASAVSMKLIENLFIYWWLGPGIQPTSKFLANVGDTRLTAVHGVIGNRIWSTKIIGFRLLPGDWYNSAVIPFNLDLISYPLLRVVALVSESFVSSFRNRERCLLIQVQSWSNFRWYIFLEGNITFLLFVLFVWKSSICIYFRNFLSQIYKSSKSNSNFYVSFGFWVFKWNG